MNREQVTITVMEAIRDLLDEHPGELEGNKNLREDLGLDSLAMEHLCGVLQERCDPFRNYHLGAIHILPEIGRGGATVNAVVEVVCRQLKVD